MQKRVTTEISKLTKENYNFTVIGEKENRKIIVHNMPIYGDLVFSFPEVYPFKPFDIQVDDNDIRMIAMKNDDFILNFFNCWDPMNSIVLFCEKLTQLNEKKKK